MNGRFFLDTNLFVYSLSHSAAAKSRRSTQLIRQAVATRNGIVSYQVIQEFFHVAFRRFTPPMSLAEAEQYLATVFRPLLGNPFISCPLRGGFAFANRYRLSWYDSLIVAGAIEAECSVLYSEDLQHGQEFGNMRIENPFS